MTASLLAGPKPTMPAPQRLNWLGLVAFALLWLELASRLRFEWSINPQYGYGWTVPFLAAYLFWRRWQSTPVASFVRGRGFVTATVMATAVSIIPAVRLVQEANPDWRLLSWAMALTVVLISAGSIYLAGGLRWLRHFAFPLLFFLVAVPWPTQFEQLIIQGLMRADAAINVEFLNAIGIPALQLGNVIEVGSGFVGIDEACTGIRSIQATFMVSLFLGDFYNFLWARRILLIFAGVCLAFGCNLIRTFLLVWLGAEHGSEAIKNWHDPAGISILTVCLFVLWGLSLLLRPQDDAASPDNAPALKTTEHRIPRGLLITIMAALVFAEGATQLWYGMHEGRMVRVKPWDVSWPRAAPNWKVVPVPESAQELLRYNEGGGGAWTDEAGHRWTMYFFRWLPGRTAGLFVRNHRPDVCLPAGGMTQRRAATDRIWNVNGVALPIRAYVFENAGDSLHVFYCYWDGAAPNPAAENQENWTVRGRLDLVRRGKRDVGTQMLEIVTPGYEESEVAERAAHAQLERIVRRG